MNDFFLTEDNSLNVSVEQKGKLLEARVQFELSRCRFDFLNDHFGLRRGKLHTLISTSGAGKSTLARSIIHDIAKKHKVLLYSTEEDLFDTQTMLAMRNVSDEVTKNIFFLHEGEVSPESTTEQWLEKIELHALNNQAECLIFDNLTTSDFYEPFSPSKQGSVFTKIKNLAKKLNIPFFLIAHTTSSVKDDQQGLIRAEDIWGSKSPARKSHFLYIYQRIVGQASQTGLSTPMFGIVRVLKARGYDTHQIYLLDYKHETSEYTGDSKIPNTKFKEIYDSRFKLGK